jgi:hypothetical protein
MTPNTHFTVSNVPSGLTLSVTGTSSTTATITLTGNATAHENANGVTNLTLAFLDGAFSSVPAAGITDSTKSHFIVDFDDAPTPTPVPTSTPTSTPIPVATTAPTASPTIPSGSVAGRLVDQNGNGVPNVVMYISKLEPEPSDTSASSNGQRVASTITDENGNYSFDGLEPGSYQIEPNLTGFTFEPPVVSVTDGNAAPAIAAVPVNLNDAGCLRTNVAAAIVASDDRATKLANFSLSSIERFLERAERLTPTERKRLRRSLKSAQVNLESELDKLLELSMALPKVTITCQGRVDCRTQTLKRTVQRYRSLNDSLRRLGFFVLRKGQASLDNVKQTDRQLRRLHAEAVRKGRQLPRRTDVCQ